MVQIDAVSDCTVISETPRRSRWLGYVTRVMAGIRDGGEMYARYQALEHMSRTDRARRGISRDTISKVILHGGGM